MSVRIVAFGDFADVRSISVRVAPIDVGLDLRDPPATTIEIRADCDRASYADRAGDRFVVLGTAEQVARELRRHGYRVRVLP